MMIRIIRAFSLQVLCATKYTYINSTTVYTSTAQRNKKIDFTLQKKLYGV